MNTLIYKTASDIDKLSCDVVQLLRQNNIMLVTAESCTGGLLSGAVTSVNGSSEVFGLGLCTYANEAKERFLDVNSAILKDYGAVSEQTALEMARGALNAARFSEKMKITAVSVTGIAGPGGGSSEKPVGTVHFACVSDTAEKKLHLRINVSSVEEKLQRSFIRFESVRQALILIRDVLTIL